MKRAKRFLVLVAVVLIAGLWSSGCDSGPTEPAPVMKTPEQIAAEALEAARKIACTQAGIEPLHLQGGFSVFRVASKDDLDVRGDPKNANGAILELSCDPPFSREAAWTHLADGVRVRVAGAIRSLRFGMNVEGDGLVVTLVTHVSQGKVFKGEVAMLVSSVGVSSRSLTFDEEIGVHFAARRILARIDLTADERSRARSALGARGWLP